MVMLQRCQESRLLIGVHKQLVWRSGVRLQAVALGLLKSGGQGQGMQVRSIECDDVGSVLHECEAAGSWVGTMCSAYARTRRYVVASRSRRG